MNYPFDNAQPLTAQAPTDTRAPGVPQCVIHPHQINHEGNVLVQVHTHQPNGQTHTHSYYVSRADMPAFIQQHKQQYPTMQFTEQPTSHTTQQHQQPLTTQLPFSPYDKYGSSYSSCDASFGAPLVEDAQRAPHSSNTRDASNC